MEEYTEIKKTCCSRQKENWVEMINGLDVNNKDEVNIIISSEKDKLFDHYNELNRSLQKIRDPQFVNNETVRMFEKMVELAEFNGGNRIGSEFVVKRGINDERTRTARWMAIMGKGIVSKNNILDTDGFDKAEWQADFFRIETLYLGKDVSELAQYAAAGLNSLVNVFFHPDSKCVEFGEGAFNNNRRLKQIIIPDKVVTIGGYCFDSCYELSNVVIGKNVRDIGELAFNATLKLETINIPDSVLTLGHACFYRENEKEIYKLVKKGNNYIAKYKNLEDENDRKDHGGLRNVSGMKNVEEIGASAFKGNHYLKTIHLGGKIVRIGRECFYNLQRLEEITLTYNKNLEIGYRAFDGLENLRIVNLVGGTPEKWIEVLKGHFNKCSKLEELAEAYEDQVDCKRLNYGYKNNYSVSDEIIYLINARMFEKDAAQLSTGGGSKKRLPACMLREYIGNGGFSPTRM